MLTTTTTLDAIRSCARLFRASHDGDRSQYAFSARPNAETFLARGAGKAGQGRIPVLQRAPSNESSSMKKAGACHWLNILVTATTAGRSVP